MRKLPDKVAAEWAKSLEGWPQEKANELDEAGLPATQVLKIALEEAEKTRPQVAGALQVK